MTSLARTGSPSLPASISMHCRKGHRSKQREYTMHSLLLMRALHHSSSCHCSRYLFCLSPHLQAAQPVNPNCSFLVSAQRSQQLLSACLQ